MDNDRKIKAGLIVYLIFFALAVRTWFNAFVIRKSCNRTQKDLSWDYLIFTQQWPASSCILWEEQNKDNVCVSETFLDYWTIHGIWPTKNSTIGPEYCNDTVKFDPSEIKGLVTVLDRDWPNIRENFTESSLWQHEWSKHGTCLLSQPKLGGEFDYFSTGLDLAVKNNITEALSSHGIIPSRSVSYNASQIWTVISDHFHVVPKMDCGFDKDLKEHILWQLKLCFSKDLQLVDCPLAHSADHLGSCPLTKPIFYPTNDLISTKKAIKRQKFVNELVSFLKYLERISIF